MRAAATVVVLVAAASAALVVAPRHAAAGGMEPFLVRLSGEATAGRNLASLSSATASPLHSWDEDEAARGRVRVQITRASGSRWEPIRSRLLAVCPDASWEIESGPRAQVVVPVAALRALAGDGDLLYVERPPRPIALDAADVPFASLRAAAAPATVSEGVARIGAPGLHAAGWRGSNVRIAILDLGFDGYEALLGTELPARVTVRSFFKGADGNGDITGDGEDHGTACAEIVHDIAPNAEIYLVNIETLLDLDRAVSWLIDQEVAVISHSVGWYFGGLNGTGPVTEIADRAAAAGIVWVNASGNEAERHTWTPGADADGDTELEFEGGDERLDFADLPIGTRLDLVLLWDQWPTAIGTNLAIEILDETGAVLATSDTPGSASPYAFRMVEWVAETGRPVAARVRIVSGSVAGRTIHVFRVGQGVRMQDHMRRDRSLLCPSDSRRVLAVGAAYWRDESLDSYSSRGALDAPAADMKPELLAPTGVSTRTYGSEGFRGTSASAPHAAGAAALVCGTGIDGIITRLQWTRDEIQRVLEAAAADPAAEIVPLRWGLLRVPIDDALVRVRPGADAIRVASNPARGAIRWFASSPTATILDAMGRVVARDARSPWDGRDAGGAVVPAGRYWITTPSSRHAAGVVWLGR